MEGAAQKRLVIVSSIAQESRFARLNSGLGPGKQIAILRKSHLVDTSSPGCNGRRLCLSYVEESSDGDTGQIAAAARGSQRWAGPIKYEDQ